MRSQPNRAWIVKAIILWTKKQVSVSIIEMQTLGLISKPLPADNIFKRLLWPAIESQYDVDLLGQQGFWICTGVALISLVLLIVLGMPMSGMFTAAVFFLGGCGVRERSIAAAVLVFFLYLWNLIAAVILGGFGNPVFQLIILMLLFANVRATILSRRWVTQPSESDLNELPERSQASMMERFANRLPVKLWPTSKYVFFPLAAILILLSAAGVVMTKRRAQIPDVSQPGSSTTIQVAPANN